jgi:hypothetical protein
MLPVDQLSTELPAGWFAFALVCGVMVIFGKQAAAWLLMKLYEFFIGRKKNLTNIGQ